MVSEASWGTRLALAGAGFVLGVVVLLGGAAAGVASLLAGSGPCGAPGLVSPANGGSLTSAQRGIARTVIEVGKSLGVPERGWVIALATALQESGLRNLHHGSGSALGVFQQQPDSGWGSPAQVLNPAMAAEAFYGAEPVGMTTNTGLMEVPGWRHLPLTVAAQDVQRSAYPNAYAKWEGEAVRIVIHNAGVLAVALPLWPRVRGKAGTGIVVTATAPGGCAVPAAGPSGYENPLRSVTALVPERIDQGVDYSGTGPIYAVGPGVVLNTAGPGWPGGTYIAYRLTSGPAAGKVVYVAEDIRPGVLVGQKVTATTVVGTMFQGPDGVETGWGQPSGAPQALGSSQWSGVSGASGSTAYGVNFDRLLVSLGAPSGIAKPPISGGLPPRWPTW